MFTSFFNYHLLLPSNRNTKYMREEEVISRICFYLTQLVPIWKMNVMQNVLNLLPFGTAVYGFACIIGSYLNYCGDR